MRPCQRFLPFVCLGCVKHKHQALEKIFAILIDKRACVYRCGRWQSKRPGERPFDMSCTRTCCTLLNFFCLCWRVVEVLGLGARAVLLETASTPSIPASHQQ